MSKTILLSCCAPCSCAVIQKMAEDKKDFTVLFYNPNIQPIEEYEKRREENEKLCLDLNVPFFSLEYDPQEWFKAIEGHENDPERGERCRLCFLIRLRKAAKYAKENGFSILTSVLGVSRHKDFDQATAAGKQAATEYGILYDETNWRKGGLEQKRQEMIKERHMYSQDYCGCPYSRKPYSSSLSSSK